MTAGQRLPFFGAIPLLLGISASSARADLHDYVKTPDKAFSWKLKNKVEVAAGTMYHLRLVSQEWQGILWEHDIQLFFPKGVDVKGTMFLWNQGGKPGIESGIFGMELATRMQAPVALLFGIPNQPLLDGKREDALIAETFVRFLKTKDANWPLLFPMVKSLVPVPDTPEAKSHWRMVDPWHYRDQLTMPTLIVNGTNDPYWTTDALNLYWDDLKSPRWILYVPNAGHGLVQEHASGKKDRNRSLATLGAFVYHQIHKKEMPKLTWKHGDAEGKLVLDVASTPAPKAARLWVAQAPTRDFRKAKWEERGATMKEGTIRGEVAPPVTGFLAVFGELEFEANGQPFYLSTQMRIVGKE